MFMNIEVERIRHYLSRETLAGELGIKVGTLHDWIHRREAIPANQLRALSRLFGCSVDYLLKERR